MLVWSGTDTDTNLALLVVAAAAARARRVQVLLVLLLRPCDRFDLIQTNELSRRIMCFLMI